MSRIRAATATLPSTTSRAVAAVIVRSPLCWRSTGRCTIRSAMAATLTCDGVLRGIVLERKPLRRLFQCRWRTRHSGGGPKSQLRWQGGLHHQSPQVVPRVRPEGRPPRPPHPERIELRELVHGRVEAYRLDLGCGSCCPRSMSPSRSARYDNLSSSLNATKTLRASARRPKCCSTTSRRSAMPDVVRNNWTSSLVDPQPRSIASRTSSTP